MNESLKNKYLVRKSANAEWVDVTTLFDGVRVLKISGYNDVGKPINVYTEQWINSQREDFAITTQNGSGEDVVIRENSDIEITFIVSNKYAVNSIDLEEQHDSFISYMTGGSLFVKSRYTKKEVECINLEGYKPTTEKLHRGINSYIIGTIKLHMLERPVFSEGEVHVGDLYIGFGGASINDPTALTNVQHYNVSNAEGNYTITCQSLSYLWICFSGSIGNVVSEGFKIPMSDYISVGDLRCYRSTNSIKPHTMNFTITD